MATTEHTINDAIAEHLRQLRSAWREPGVISSENTGALVASTGRPDIVIAEANVAPVSIETEVLPAVTVEVDAASRLGATLKKSGRTISASIAVRLDPVFRTVAGGSLSAVVKNNQGYEYCLLTSGIGGHTIRWPSKGWLKGGLGDLAMLAQAAAIPPSIIDAAADKLVRGITAAASILDDISESHGGSTAEIAKELKQEDGIQTRRMASAILANALVFHDALAGGGGALASVNGLQKLRGVGGITRSALLAEWRKILKVNYWPIFDVARRMLEHLPPAESAILIDKLASTAESLLESNLMRSHDLTGAVFQRLIADRKFLAAYYTTPASAALLAGLAVRRESNPAGRPWSEKESLESLKVGDFACGTGTLLSTAYQRIGQLYELAGGNAAALHPRMMSTALVGCDVLPAAAHLTASMLAGAHPNRKFGGSLIITLGYGIQPDGGVSLGSIDLLNPQAKIHPVAPSAKAAGGQGEASVPVWTAVANNSFDLILMNPPFTRPTGHEGEKVGVRNPMFAAFSASKKEQGVMAREAAKLTHGTAYHGNAGEASAFSVLADRKLKEGGTLGLVLPLSFLVGDAWGALRSLVAASYGDIMVVSIAGAKDSEMSFSADTNMGECLLIARKGAGPSTRATFVVLNERPAHPMVGAAIAEAISEKAAAGNVRELEGGPSGGTPIHVGADVVGTMMSARIHGDSSWSLARISDLSLAQTAYQVTKGRVWLPGIAEAAAPVISITLVKNLGQVGPYHMDINGAGSNGAIRGPFVVEPSDDAATATYPILWAQDAKLQNHMGFEPDCEGVLKLGASQEENAIIQKKALSLMDSASHCHFNRDFRFNSQALGMQFTSRPAIGGRAWLSIKVARIEHEKALVLWGNSSLGMLVHWWSSNKQQAGRGSVGKVSLADMPVFDVRALSEAQLATAADIFSDLRNKTLMPLYQINQDAIRKEIDERFLCGVLGMAATFFCKGGAFELLREKLAKEPSIRGSKV